jgi:RNA polymerase sigma-70 factor (ECF subfamily)
MVTLEDDSVAEPAISDTPESILVGHAERQLLNEALEQLALPFREIILLCDLEEMSYQEIAQTLGVPIGTVMSRLSRARRALRESVRKKMVCDDRSMDRKTRTVS